MLYSPSTGGFYLAARHIVPEDAVEITADRYTALMAAQVAGQSIQAGEDGYPVAVDRVVLTEAEMLVAARSTMSLTRVQFALVCLSRALISEAEAEALVSRGEVPAICAHALGLIEDQDARTMARIRFIGANSFARTDEFAALFARAADYVTVPSMAVDEEALDLFFADGAKL